MFPPVITDPFFYAVTIPAVLLLGINRAIIWEMPFFGPDFVIFRFLISLPMPLLLGFLARLPIFDALAAKRNDAP